MPNLLHVLRQSRRLFHALRIARRVHRGQRDLAGQPYLRHVLTVGAIAWLLESRLDAAIVGVLHDAMEDVAEDRRAWASNQISSHLGFMTWMEVSRLTRARCTSYGSYIASLFGLERESVCVPVKIADVLHNLAPHRRRTLLGTSPQFSTQLNNRYARALITLGHAQINRQPAPLVPATSPTQEKPQP